MGQTLTIDARFCGPPGLGNGGYVCGMLAGAFGPTDAVEVTLRRGAPVARALAIERADGVARLQDGDTLIAEARPAELTLDVPAAPDFATASRAAESFPGFAWHAFPNCFGCGHARAPGDGLRVLPGPVPGRDLLATGWVPDASFADPDGLVRPEFLWAALDCPGGWAVIGAGRRQVLLGRLTARVAPRIRAGERCTVIAWALGADGRKLGAGSALFGADGECAGAARATWIEIPAAAGAAP